MLTLLKRMDPEPNLCVSFFVTIASILKNANAYVDAKCQWALISWCVFYFVSKYRIKNLEDHDTDESFMSIRGVSFFN